MTVIKFNFVIKNAHTKPGESVYLVGSIPQLGAWKDINSVLLKTSPEAYPCWRTPNDSTVVMRIKKEDKT